HQDDAEQGDGSSRNVRLKSPKSGALSSLRIARTAMVRRSATVSTTNRRFGPSSFFVFAFVFCVLRFVFRPALLEACLVRRIMGRKKTWQPLPFQTIPNAIAHIPFLGLALSALGCPGCCYA